MSTAIALSLVATAPATADQTDPRLDKLFDRLDAIESQQKGLRIVRKIWSIWYEHPNSQVTRAMRDAHNAMRAGEPGVALAMFDQATRLDPAYAEAWNGRATAHFMLGNYEKSLQDITRTLEREPRHFGALAGRGRCYLALDKPRKALVAFEESLEINPHQPGTKQRARRLREKLEGKEI
jgi:tetratricopeptide (TPR) repeat protein